MTGNMLANARVYDQWFASQARQMNIILFVFYLPPRERIFEKTNAIWFIKKPKVGLHIRQKKKSHFNFYTLPGVQHQRCFATMCPFGNKIIQEI